MPNNNLNSSTTPNKSTTPLDSLYYQYNKVLQATDNGRPFNTPIDAPKHKLDKFAKLGVLPRNDYNMEQEYAKRYTDQVERDRLQDYRDQSWADLAFNSILAQGVVGQIIGGTISGIGDIPGWVYSQITSEPQFRTMLSDFGDAITEGVAEAAPIYLKNPNRAFATNDPAWYFQRVTDAFSTLGLMIPAAGWVKAVGMASKIPRLGKALKTIQAADKMVDAEKALGTVEKLGKSTDRLKVLTAIKNTDKFKNNAQFWTNTVGMAAFSRLGENMKEARGTYELVYKDTRSRLMSKDLEEQKQLFKDEDFLEYLKNERPDIYDNYKTTGIVPTLDDYTIEQISRHNASKAGMRNMNINYANFAFDVLQFATIGKMFKPTTRVGKFMNPTIAKAQAQSMGKTLVKGNVLNRTTNYIGRNRGFITGSLSEGPEEFINYIAGEESATLGRQLVDGKNSDNASFNGIANRIWNKYLNDPHAWESAVSGVMGGVLFQGGANIFNKAYQKYKGVSPRYSSANRVKEINSRGVSIAKSMAMLKLIDQGYNIKETTEVDGKVGFAKIEGPDADIQKQVLTNEVLKDMAKDMSLNAARYGNVDLLKEYFNSPYIKEELVKNGFASEEDITEKLDTVNSIINRVESKYEEGYSKLFTSKASPVAKEILLGDFVNNDFNKKLLDDELTDVHDSLTKFKSSDEYISLLQQYPKIEHAIAKMVNTQLIKDIEDSIADLTKDENYKGEYEILYETLVNKRDAYKKANELIDAIDELPSEDVISDNPILHSIALNEYTAKQLQFGKDRLTNENLAIEKNVQSKAKVIDKDLKEVRKQTIKSETDKINNLNDLDSLAKLKAKYKLDGDRELMDIVDKRVKVLKDVKTNENLNKEPKTPKSSSTGSSSTNAKLSPEAKSIESRRKVSKLTLEQADNGYSKQSDGTWKGFHITDNNELIPVIANSEEELLSALDNAYNEELASLNKKKTEDKKEVDKKDKPIEEVKTLTPSELGNKAIDIFTTIKKVYDLVVTTATTMHNAQSKIEDLNHNRLSFDELLKTALLTPTKSGDSIIDVITKLFNNPTNKANANGLFEAMPELKQLLDTIFDKAGLNFDNYLPLVGTDFDSRVVNNSGGTNIVLSGLERDVNFKESDKKGTITPISKTTEEYAKNILSPTESVQKGESVELAIDENALVITDIKDKDFFKKARFKLIWKAKNLGGHIASLEYYDTELPLINHVLGLFETDITKITNLYNELDKWAKSINYGFNLSDFNKFIETYFNNGNIGNLNTQFAARQDIARREFIYHMISLFKYGKENNKLNISKLNDSLLNWKKKLDNDVEFLNDVLFELKSYLDNGKPINDFRYKAIVKNKTNGDLIRPEGFTTKLHDSFDRTKGNLAFIPRDKIQARDTKNLRDIKTGRVIHTSKYDYGYYGNKIYWVTTETPNGEPWAVPLYNRYINKDEVNTISKLILDIVEVFKEQDNVTHNDIKAMVDEIATMVHVRNVVFEKKDKITNEIIREAENMSPTYSDMVFTTNFVPGTQKVDIVKIHYKSEGKFKFAKLRFDASNNTFAIETGTSEYKIENGKRVKRSNGEYVYVEEGTSTHNLNSISAFKTELGNLLFNIDTSDFAYEKDVNGNTNPNFGKFAEKINGYIEDGTLVTNVGKLVDMDGNKISNFMTTGETKEFNNKLVITIARDIPANRIDLESTTADKDEVTENLQQDLNKESNITPTETMVDIYTYDDNVHNYTEEQIRELIKPEHIEVFRLGRVPIDRRVYEVYYKMDAEGVFDDYEQMDDIEIEEEIKLENDETVEEEDDNIIYENDLPGLNNNSLDSVTPTISQPINEQDGEIKSKEVNPDVINDKDKTDKGAENKFNCK